MIGKAGRIFTAAYLLLMFVIYPFYVKDGYVGISEAKFQFLFFCSLGTAIILLVPFICSIWKNFKLSVTDLFILLFSVGMTISFFLSEDHTEALWGTEGWYLGYVLLLLLFILYFLISRLYQGQTLLLAAGLIASAGIAVLGITDRFSFYILPFQIRDTSFLSTLGNINWYTGYLILFTALGGSLFLMLPRYRIWLGCYCTVLFTAGICQGGSGVFVFYTALFICLLWISIGNKERLKQLLILGILWCTSAQLLRLIRFWFPGKYNYETKNLCGFFSGSSASLLLAGIFLAGYLILSRIQKIHRFRILLLIITGSVLTGVLITLILHTKLGIQDLFFFDSGWGNGRGIIYRTGWMAFISMSPLQKLFGVGPDCFSSYVYHYGETASLLRDYFGSDRLTNAHNEVLTMLVNFGIVGTGLYYGIFISFIRRCQKKAGENPYLTAIVIMFISCFIYQMFSFIQIISYPYVWILLAMGEVYLNSIEN